jgi:hypothetical protein
VLSCTREEVGFRDGAMAEASPHRPSACVAEPPFAFARAHPPTSRTKRLRAIRSPRLRRATKNEFSASESVGNIDREDGTADLPMQPTSNIHGRRALTRKSQAKDHPRWMQAT